MTQERLFISHAGEDAERANRIVAHLEARGVACWIAPRDIPLKSVYAEEITRALQTCKACAVIVSASANASEAIKRELELASHYRRPFVPIRIDATEPGPGLDYYLRNTQWLDLRSNEQVALDRLVAHLKAPGAENAASPPASLTQSSGAKPPIALIGAGVALVAVSAVGVFFYLQQRAPTPATETPTTEFSDTWRAAAQALTGNYNWDGIACGAGPAVSLVGEHLQFAMSGTQTLEHEVLSVGATAGSADTVRTRVITPGDHADEEYLLTRNASDGALNVVLVAGGTERADVWSSCTIGAPDETPPTAERAAVPDLSAADTSWTGVWGDGVQLTWHLKADGRACHFYPHAGNREVCSWRWTQNGAQLALDSGPEIWNGELSENGAVFAGQMGPTAVPTQRQAFRFTRD